MRKLGVAVALAAGVAGAGPAMASCQHNGIYYEVGAVLCFEGYLQECTPASYWKAIGMCHAEDPLRPVADAGPADEQALLAALIDRIAPPAGDKTR